MPAIDEGCSQPALRLTLGDASYFTERAWGAVAADDEWIQQIVLPDGSIHIRVREVLQTIVSPDGHQAVCAWLEGADPLAFEANLLNFVVSTSLTLQGEEPLHATVVDLGGRVVGLLGDSGAGKTTLAAYLIAQGGKLVTDDMLRLELSAVGARVHSGPYRLKLNRDSAERFLPQAAGRGHFNRITGKILVQPSDGGASAAPPRPMHALFWLNALHESPGRPEVVGRRLRGNELARALISSAMNIRYHAPDRLERLLRFAQKVGEAVPVYALEYPRTFAILDQVTEEIRRRVSA